MTEEQLKQQIAQLKQQEDETRKRRHDLESKLFEITANKIKKTKTP